MTDHLGSEDAGPLFSLDGSGGLRVLSPRCPECSGEVTHDSRRYAYECAACRIVFQIHPEVRVVERAAPQLVYEMSDTKGNYWTHPAMPRSRKQTLAKEIGTARRKLGENDPGRYVVEVLIGPCDIADAERMMAEVDGLTMGELGAVVSLSTWDEEAEGGR